MNELSHAESTAVHALPAEILNQGFSFLLLRQFVMEQGPPVFAFVDQNFVRSPQRLARHGLWFAPAFRPEIVAWLSEKLGRPSLRDGADKPFRNPLWPGLDWRGVEKDWADGARSIEWRIEVDFAASGCWPAFQRDWRDRLRGAAEESEAGS